MRRLIAVILFAVLTLAGCRPLFRAPALEPKKPVDDETVAKTMNLDLVSDLGTKTIAFEVHWVEGYRPTEYALDGLREAIARFAPEKTVTIEVDPEPIPRKTWDDSNDGEAGADLWVERYGKRIVADAGATPIQIHYVPSGRKWFDIGFFGMARRTTLDRPDGSSVKVPVVFMASQTIVDNSILWLAPTAGERSTLIHEFGHLLGLARSPTHAQRDDPIHCTEPQCVMAPPRMRNILYNAPRGFFTARIPTWYCKKCMGDLASARRFATTERAAGRDPFARTVSTEGVNATRHEIAALLRRGREDEAKRRLEALLSELPYHDDYYELAISVWGLGWYAEAERLFGSVLRNAPSQQRGASAQYLLDVICAQGRYEEALGKMGDLPYGYVRLLALQALGRHDEAVAAARLELGTAHNRSETVWMERQLVETLRQAGRFAEAIETLRRSQGKRRITPRQYLLEGELLLDAGRTADAERAFRGVVKEAGSTPKGSRTSYGVRVPEARAHAHLGDAGAARVSLCGSPTCKATGWDRAEWAKIQVLLGDPAGALESLLQARTEEGVGRLNPCLDRDLRVLQDDPRFAEFFPCAPKPAK